MSNNGAGCPAGVDPTVDSQIIACALDLDLKNAPSYKTSLGVLYSFPWYRGDLSFSGDMNFEDETWSLVANSPAHARIDFDAILNARIKYEDERGWSIAVFGRNLTDEEYYRASSASSFTTYASPPLEYGIEIGAEF